jgi:hypothetical protein
MRGNGRSLRRGSPANGMNCNRPGPRGKQTFGYRQVTPGPIRMSGSGTAQEALCRQGFRHTQRTGRRRVEGRETNVVQATCSWPVAGGPVRRVDDATRGLRKMSKGESTRCVATGRSRSGARLQLPPGRLRSDVPKRSKTHGPTSTHERRCRRERRSCGSFRGSTSRIAARP